MKHKIDSVRNDYNRSDQDFNATFSDPISLFDHWMEEALHSEEKEPTAMALSTVGADGFPQTRIVLLKIFDTNGLVFFTNYFSEKGKAIERNGSVALLFFWPLLERQVRITGKAVKTDDTLSDRYFSSRPRESCIAAWASEQSKEISSRADLEERVDRFEEKFKGQLPSRPPFWGGFRVIPQKIEFWQGRSNRLHDRILYTKTTEGWKNFRLAP